MNNSTELYKTFEIVRIPEDTFQCKMCSWISVDIRLHWVTDNFHDRSSGLSFPFSLVSWATYFFRLVTSPRFNFSTYKIHFENSKDGLLRFIIVGFFPGMRNDRLNFLNSDSWRKYCYAFRNTPVLTKMKFQYKNLCYTISWVHVFTQQMFDNVIVKVPELGFAKDTIHYFWIYCH